MSKEIKHDRRSFLGTAALSIITAKIALMDAAHASVDKPKGYKLGFAPAPLLTNAGVLGFAHDSGHPQKTHPGAF
jgi:hypothetical protein